MELKQEMQALTSSKEFKSWKDSDEHSYLAHLFLMKDENNVKNLQIGYYDPDKDKMLVFIKRNDHFEKSSEMDIFKKEKAKIDELNLEDVTIDFTDANKIALELKEKHYLSEMIQREIQILQMIDQEPIFNNTYITKSFKILNVKVNAKTKEVIHHSIESLMNLGKFERGNRGATNQAA